MSTHSYIPAVRPNLYKKKNGTYSSRKLAASIESHNNAVVLTAADQNQLYLGCYQPVARPYFIKKSGKLKNSPWKRAEKSYSACISGEERTGGIVGGFEDLTEFALDIFDQLTNPAGLTDEQAQQAFQARSGESTVGYGGGGMNPLWIGGAVAVGLGLLVFSQTRKG